MKKWALSLLIITLFTCVKAQTNVVFYTTEGNFMVEIHDDVSPITGGNFLSLVNEEFYDGIIFHRVIDNFIIQGGDPTGTGSGGPGYTIEDEFIPTLSNVKMTISMANSGPSSGGSQFFFNMVDNVYLDFDQEPLSSKHPVFGIVTQNFNVVEEIAGVPVNGANRPITNVIMDSIRVTDVILGVSEGLSEEGFEIKVFPNPLNDNSIMRVASKVAEATEIQLLDAYGKVLSRSQVDLLQGVNDFELHSYLSKAHAAGIYYLRIVANESVQTVRIAIP